MGLDGSWSEFGTQSCQGMACKCESSIMFYRTKICCCLDKDELESTLRIMDERADHGEVHERAS